MLNFLTLHSVCVNKDLQHSNRNPEFGDSNVELEEPSQESSEKVPTAGMNTETGVVMLLCDTIAIIWNWVHAVYV